MKAIRNWVLLADAHRARVMSYDVPSKRLVPVEGANWTAEPPAEFSDEAGVMPSRVGAGRASISRSDPALQAEIAFAKSIVIHLNKAREKGRFDKLIVAAAPHMLGVLRAHITPDLQALIHVELDKDLTQSDPEKLMQSLAGVFPI